jgi:hypothetical protein
MPFNEKKLESNWDGYFKVRRYCLCYDYLANTVPFWDTDFKN